MINVTLINSQSDSENLKQQLPDETTYRELLSFNKVNTNKMVVTVRVDGEKVSFDLDDVVEDGARVTVTPEEIKGA